MGNNIVMPFNGTSQDNQVNSLIFSENGEFFTTSEAIAEGTGNQHKNVLELIRSYLSDLNEFNPVAFQTLKGKALPQGGFAKSREIALLNEDQATFLMTLMSNSKIVVDFKKRLVKAFRELANQASQAPITQPTRLPTPKELAMMLIEAENKAEELLAITNEQKKVIEHRDVVIVEQKDVIEAQDDFIDRAFKIKSEMSVNKYCKLVNLQPNKFRNLMKISGRFVYDSYSQSYMPSSEMISKGHMDYKDNDYTDENGRIHEHTQIFITKYGAKHIYTFCKKYKAFFDMLEHETKGYLFMPMQDRKAFLNSLLKEKEASLA